MGTGTINLKFIVPVPHTFYKDGAEIYSMCQSKFERMAREAKATYKLDKLVLVNTEIFEKYLETFRVVE